jgi:hypothetical protein
VRSRQVRKLRDSSPWQSIVSRFWYVFPKYKRQADNDAQADENGELSDNVYKFWRVYIFQGTWNARAWRVAAGVVALALLWLIMWLFFGNPRPPTRGVVSFWTYKLVTMLLVASTATLIFFVADTTVLTLRIVNEFVRTADSAAIWPSDTLQDFRTQLGLLQNLDSLIADWAALRFVSDRTKCITLLIYYPFVIIALLIFYIVDFLPPMELACQMRQRLV